MLGRIVTAFYAFLGVLCGIARLEGLKGLPSPTQTQQSGGDVLSAAGLLCTASLIFCTFLRYLLYL